MTKIPLSPYLLSDCSPSPSTSLLPPSSPSPPSRHPSPSSFPLLHGGSLYLYPFLFSNPSFPLLPFLLMHFSTTSSSKAHQRALPFHGGSLHLYPFSLITHPFPAPSSSSSSSSKPIHEPSHSMVAPSTSIPSSLATPLSSSLPSLPSLIPSFSSSNPTHKVFNATLTLHTNLHDPILPLHGSSLHLRPFLAGDPSFLLTPFSSLSFSSKPIHEPFPSIVAPSTSTLSLLATPPPLLPHLFSSSSFNPTHETFNATLHANLRDPTLPLHNSSLHLHPFLAGNPWHFCPLKWQVNIVCW